MSLPRKASFLSSFSGMLIGRAPEDSNLQRGYTQSPRSLESLQNIWERPLHKLATNKDLVRLCNSLIIQTDKGEILFQPTVSSGTELAKDILLGIIKHVDIENYDRLEPGLTEFLTPEKEVSGALRKIFAQKVDSCNISNTKAERILKGINQEIIFPVVRELRDRFYSLYPFRDIRGTWRVGISVAGGCVTVTHYKQEQSYSTDNPFSFHWQLDLHFNEDATTFKPEYFISQVNFPNATDHGLLEAMSPYFHRSTAYRNIWAKENHKSTLRTIASSLPRIAEGSSIATSDTLILDQTNHNSDPLTLVRDFLIHLSYYVDPPEVSEHIRGVLDEIIAAADANDLFDPTNKIKKALKNGLVPIDSKTFKILKAINNDIPMPVIMQLRTHIYPFAKYRDVKGSWRYHISLTDHQYIITMEKKECSASLKQDEYFDFTWELIITFDVSMEHMVDAEFYITEYSTHETTSPQFCLWLEKLILPFVSDSQPPKFVLKSSIPAPDILISIIKTLRQFPEIPEVDIQGYNTKESMLRLLETLYEADSRGVAFPPAYLPLPHLQDPNKPPLQ